MKIAAIQMNAVLADVFKNWETTEKLIAEAALAGAALIVLSRVLFIRNSF